MKKAHHKGDNTLISIIIPVYNVEKYLRVCLDSVINQSYSDYEVILVDDGSTDSSPAICDEYCNKDSASKLFIRKIWAWHLPEIQESVPQKANSYTSSTPTTVSTLTFSKSWYQPHNLMMPTWFRWIWHQFLKTSQNTMNTRYQN